MAFSNDGYFSNNIDEIPEGVLAWIEEEKESIKYVIENQLIQKDEIEMEWDYVTTIDSDNTSGRSTCATSIYQKGPLMTTTWGQGSTYNDLLPALCVPSNTNSTNKYLTGCVATSMAQVLKYYSKPSQFNYRQMPNNIGTPQTQALMLAAGLSVRMTYGCGASGANSGNIPDGFRNNFGYSSASYVVNNYNSNVIFNHILINKPVILTGGRKKNGLSWNYYTEGHAWVADGALFIHLRQPDASGNCLDYGFRFLHMNWGWDYNFDGWFNENNFNPSTSTFNYRRGMVINITP